MKVLCVGDIFGASGRLAAKELIPKLIQEHSIDFVITNGENAARGSGILQKHADELFAVGTDVITLGNHALRQRDIFPYLEDRSISIIRPANLHSRAPGNGLVIVDGVKSDGREVSVAVINLMGDMHLDVGESPWEMIDNLIIEAKAHTPIVFLDMHAELTSEKVAMGMYLNGKATMVYGTHTHVQTSDARILDKGTAYITDLGMSGPHGDTVIGVRSDIIIKRMQTGIGGKFMPGSEGVQLEGAIVDLDSSTGRALAVEAIRVPLKS